jgi:hypothetical protein
LKVVDYNCNRHAATKRAAVAAFTQDELAHAYARRACAELAELDAQYYCAIIPVKLGVRGGAAFETRLIL